VKTARKTGYQVQTDCQYDIDSDGCDGCLQIIIDNIKLYQQLYNNEGENQGKAISQGR
jgi:hypothetical protein